LVALALGGILLGVGIGAVKSRPATAAETARASAEYGSALARCLAGPPGAAGVPPGQSLQQVCHDTIRLENFEPSHQVRLSELTATVKGTAFLLIVLGLVVGASAMGADLQTGAMTTLLTWEPRRLRVLLIRALVVAVVVCVIVVALQAALGMAFAAAAWARGSTTVSGGWLGELAAVVLRIGVLASAMALIGLAIAAIGRNTAAALGVVFVYIALAESLLRGFVPRLTPFLLSINAVIFADGKSGSPSTDVVITPARAALVLGIYVVLLLSLSAAVFRSRDVQ
jgi:ABC-type transport system involved in multi-copper enzyme maturation permease subunit